VFTLHSENEEEVFDFRDRFSEILDNTPTVQRGVCQVERGGQTERLHIQGYLECSQAHRIFGIKRWTSSPYGQEVISRYAEKLLNKYGTITSKRIPEF